MEKEKNEKRQKRGVNEGMKARRMERKKGSK